nr:Crp/Fnr family transcriptional regulator [Parvularcula dongshanensis]
MAGIATSVERHEAGEVVVERGAPARGAFVVVDGWASRSISLSDGRRQIVNFMLPGDLFDLQVFTGRPADHTVTALTPLTTAQLDKTEMLNLFRGASPLALAFWWAAVQEEAILREQIVRNGRRSARERVAHLLLELYERLRVTGRASDDAFVLPIGQSSLADALGLSYVHVSRVLSQLERSGLIERQRMQVRLVDRPALQALCDFSTLYLDAWERTAKLG